jgi:hypothetical protein
MKEITLPIELANAVLGYLGKQPYDQVFQLIQGMQQAAQQQQANQPVQAPEVIE